MHDPKKLSERIQVTLTRAQKQRLQELAELRGSYPSVLAREAIIRFIREEIKGREGQR